MSNKHCVQYGVWANCCNSCDFCLRQMRDFYSTKEQIQWIENIRENIQHIDWKNQYSYGISLLGGELFYIKNKELQTKFLQLIDDIIEIILKPIHNPNCRFSTVTNGLYDPSFLYQCIDKIVDQLGTNYIDVNFSYDLKYRYKSESLRLKALKNINDFRDRYNYRVGVQMILTQNLINLWKSGQWDLRQFLDHDIPGCNLSFLYPHPINTGKQLKDFFFNRTDFLKFVQYIKRTDNQVYLNFINSTKHSGVFKWTGLRNRITPVDLAQQPVLSDGKEILNKCGHSILYKCYSDSDNCVLCDLKMFDGEL